MNKERIYDSINISKNELIIKRIIAAAKKIILKLYLLKLVEELMLTFLLKME